MTPPPPKDLLSHPELHTGPPPPSSSPPSPHARPVISFRTVANTEERKKGEKPSKDSLGEGTQQRRGGGPPDSQKRLLPFCMFCWNFLLFAEADGAVIGRMIAVPRSSGCWRKRYFTDRTSSRSCSDRTDRGGKNKKFSNGCEFVFAPVHSCVFYWKESSAKQEEQTSGVARKGENGPLCGCCGASSPGEKLAVLLLCQNKHQLCLHPP